MGEAVTSYSVIPELATLSRLNERPVRPVMWDLEFPPYVDLDQIVVRQRRLSRIVGLTVSDRLVIAGEAGDVTQTEYGAYSVGMNGMPGGSLLHRANTAELARTVAVHETPETNKDWLVVNTAEIDRLALNWDTEVLRYQGLFGRNRLSSDAPVSTVWAKFLQHALLEGLSDLIEKQDIAQQQKTGRKLLLAASRTKPFVFVRS